MICAFTVTRASTPERARMLNETITQARRTAGCKFHWHVVGSGCAEVGENVIKTAESTGLIDTSYCYSTNVGQHVAWNEAHWLARDKGAKYLLRLDDDCEFPSKRWLKKLVEASALLDDKMILSPTIRGLKNPPARSQVCMVKKLQLEFLTYAIGGICRLHPMELIKDYVSDVRMPLGSGDATSMASYCRNHDPIIPMAYLKHIRVRHNTRAQEERDPSHFEQHGLFQSIPYIPPWRADAAP